MVREHEIMETDAILARLKGKDHRSVRRHEERGTLGIGVGLLGLVHHIVEGKQHLGAAVKTESRDIIHDGRRIPTDRRHRARQAHVTGRTHQRTFTQTGEVLRLQSKRDR